MKSSRSDKVTAKPGPQVRQSPPSASSRQAEESGIEAGWKTVPIRFWIRFWFSPTDPIGLHLIRVFAGLLFLSWLFFTYLGNMESFLGPQGWMDTQAFGEATQLSGGWLSPGWSVAYWCGNNPTALAVFFWTSLTVLVLFTLGVYPRLTAVLTWVVIASFTANPAFEYEGDALLLILSFYLMIGYLFLGQRAAEQSLLARLLGPLRAWPLAALERDGEGDVRGSVGANLALRLLQVNLALVIVMNGLHKLQFGYWWAGVALWYPLHAPFRTTLEEALANKPHADAYLELLNIAAYATLAWQIGFPLFAWRPRWRIVLIGGAVVGWLGTAFIWHLPVVGPAFLIGCLAFVSPAGWRRLLGWLPLKTKAHVESVSRSEGTASLVAAGNR